MACWAWFVSCFAEELSVLIRGRRWSQNFNSSAIVSDTNQQPSQPINHPSKPRVASLCFFSFLSLSSPFPFQQTTRLSFLSSCTVLLLHFAPPARLPLSTSRLPTSIRHPSILPSFALVPIEPCPLKRSSVLRPLTRRWPCVSRLPSRLLSSRRFPRRIKSIIKAVSAP